MAIPWELRWPTPRAAPGQPRARVPDLVGSRLPSPYHFGARIQSFQGVAAPFAGDSVGPLAPRSRPPRRLGSRDRRSARRQPPPRRRRRNRPRPRFLPHFVTFQGFATRKISPPLQRGSHLPRDRRSAMAENNARDRLVPDALSPSPMRAPLRVARRRDLDAVVGHPLALGQRCNGSISET
jgi:hypothetical protein